MELRGFAVPAGTQGRTRGSCPPKLPALQDDPMAADEADRCLRPMALLRSAQMQGHVKRGRRVRSRLRCRSWGNWMTLARWMIAIAGESGFLSAVLASLCRLRLDDGFR